jgi:4'-phosphopantetheinyl transferase
MNAVKPMCEPMIWRDPPGVLELGKDEIHVWRTTLDQGPVAINALRQILSPDECIRADRFYFVKDRTHFITARGMLRRILSRYMRTTPERLCFTYGAYGKPALAGILGGERLRFNLSHSQDLALIAVSLDHEIGVDLEFMRADFAGMNVAEQFFSHQEVETLRSLPPDLQLEGFYNCWTRKEAYIKARGEGLSHQLNSFDVTLAPGEPAALLATRQDPNDAQRWSLATLHPGGGYVGAIAAENRNYRLHCWQGAA